MVQGSQDPLQPQVGPGTSHILSIQRLLGYGTAWQGCPAVLSWLLGQALCLSLCHMSPTPPGLRALDSGHGGHPSALSAPPEAVRVRDTLRTVVRFTLNQAARPRL